MKRILSGIIAFSVFILILIFSACSHETAESSDFVHTSVWSANKSDGSSMGGSPSLKETPHSVAQQIIPKNYYSIDLISNHPSVIEQVHPISAGSAIIGFDYSGGISIPVVEIYDEIVGSQRNICSSSHDGEIILFDYHNEIYFLEALFLDEGNLFYLHCGDRETDITSLIDPEQIPSFMAITDSNLVLGYDCEMLWFDLNGNYQSTVITPNIITDFFTMPDDSVMVLCQTAEEARMFQVKAADFENLIEIQLPNGANEYTFASGYHSPYDFILFDDRYIYGWTISSDEVSTITDCFMLGLQASNISGVAFINQTQMLLATWISGELNDRLYLLTPSEPPERIGTMTMAGISTSRDIASAISDYNLQHQELPIIYIDYMELYGDRAVEQLSVDIATGNVPDLICLNGIPYNSLANDDLLANLYTLMESDEGYTKDDFFENQLAALEYSPGVLLRMPQSVSICTVIGLKSVIGEKYTWTFEELYDTYERSGANTLFYSQTPEQVLKELLFQSFSHFANYSTGNVNFESEEFISLLNFSKYCSGNTSDYDDDELTCLRKKEILLMPVLLSRFDQYTEISEKLDGDLIFVGYPDAGGSTLYLNNPVAIMSSSPYIKEAWQFIKLFISSNRYSSRGGWPLRREDLAHFLSAELATGANTNEAVSICAELQAIDHCADFDKTLSSIVMDEAETFFFGKKTAEETAGLIQNRTELYFSEIRTEE